MLFSVRGRFGVKGQKKSFKTITPIVIPHCVYKKNIFYKKKIFKHLRNTHYNSAQSS